MATHRIGFISTRLAGTDGVSLETTKWASALKTMDCECFYFAGESDHADDHSMIVPEAHFEHSDIAAIQDDLFGDYTRSRETSQAVQRLQNHLKEQLYRFVQKFDLDLLIVENAVSLPMNVPLGLAITEFVAETNIQTIAHDHDFVWERSRFAVNAAQDYLHTAFPPVLRTLRHVVINSFASEQLALRIGAHSVTLIPNVMNFEQPPPAADDYAADMRKVLGIAPDDIFLLQPTRVVPRKRIELAMDLTRRLGRKAVLVVTHSAGDEGLAYERFLHEHAAVLGVRVLFVSEFFSPYRVRTKDGRKIYGLADAYQQADLVTYTSSVEGFGNAFLETIYYQRPLVMSNYEIFKTDIQPKGFQVIGFDDFISDETVEQCQYLLENPAEVQKMVSENYELGRRHYSYKALEEHLRVLLTASTPRT